jgi:SAM-dependent methyltransferase
VSRLWQRLSAPVRRLRWAASTWSTKADQAFHDSQFAALAADPFSPSYPGYLTIRRFADHAERSLDRARIVVDLGCGPGEITCELARRHPDIVFTGIDHSDVGIATARRHAERLRLANAVFEMGDIEHYEPRTPVDLVMMFDAFHHLLDPRAFVSRLRRSTKGFFLIEPAGTWSGGWERSQDLDWLPETIGQIGRRLEYQFGMAPQPKETMPAVQPPEQGEPTEHRYTLSDFEQFFDGYALDIRGTIAGLERYGPGPDDRSSFRDRLGTVTYDLVVSLEHVLYEEGVDLAAKHWAIAATSEPLSPSTRERVQRRLPPRPAQSGLLRAYGVTYGECTGSGDVRRGQPMSIRVPVTNTGWLTWDSTTNPPVFASYHWLDRQGRMLVHDGERTPLPAPVAPGGSCTLDLRVVAPDTSGRVTLVIDLVHEGRTWFSEQGATALDIHLDLD